MDRNIARAGGERRVLRIGTRGSALALWQARWAADVLRARFPGLRVELVVIRVESDRQPEAPIPEIGTRGVFTRDIELALLEGRIGAAVHSLKDLPSADTPGLALAAAGPRDDPRDALVTPNGARLEDLPPGARVGTSSLRRAALLREARPDLAVEPIRGNIGTRLRKLREGRYDAIVMALAALHRLDEAVPAVPFDPASWIPAVAQGVIGVQARVDDAFVTGMLGAISDADAMLVSTVERGFLAALGGGCSVPVGGYATARGDAVTLRGFVGAADGTRALRAVRTLPIARARELGPLLGADLRRDGADEILAALRKGTPLLEAGAPR